MDVEKIMEEERKRANKGRVEEEKRLAKFQAENARNEADLQAAWESIRGAVSRVPGVTFEEDGRRAVAASGWIGVYYARLGVGATYGIPESFAPKDWKKAVELFVRNVARTGA